MFVTLKPIRIEKIAFSEETPDGDTGEPVIFRLAGATRVRNLNDLPVELARLLAGCAARLQAPQLLAASANAAAVSMEEIEREAV